MTSLETLKGLYRCLNPRLRVPSMRSPVSSAIRFFPFFLALRARCTVGLLARCFRSEIAFPTRLAERRSSRLKLAASLEGRRHALRSPATTFYPCPTYLVEAPESVFAYWRSVEAWYRDDPSLLRYAYAHPELRPVARTSLQRDETVVPLVFSWPAEFTMYTGLAW
jgi:hypothetical protein